MSTEEITPGTVNKARTKFVCYYCEEHFVFDSSWKSIEDAPSACPNCTEDPFVFVCDAFYCDYSTQCATTGHPPSFPDQTCAECGKTQEEVTSDRIEEEETEKEVEEEKKRIEEAKAYRQRKNNGTHQGRIENTYGTLHGLSRDPYHPTSLEDALRMREEDFVRIRPLIEHELRLRNLNANQYLTTSYCKSLISFFERSWLEENADGLHYGVTRDVTGLQRLVYRRNLDPCHIRLRMIREGMDESLGLFAACPAVKIESIDPNDTIGAGALKVVWEEDESGDDPCEIYRKDGKTTLTLPEFLVWMARMVGLGGLPENPKYSPSEDKADLGMPPDYVPTDWVGRPKLWEKEKDCNFPRWFWMREEASKGSISFDDLIDKSRRNMMRCCHCYGLPASDNPDDLISCSCEKLVFCSEECKTEVMKVHKFSCLGASECANCLTSSTYTKLQKCSRCKNAKYCTVECQREDWKNGHKRKCVRDC